MLPIGLTPLVQTLKFADLVDKVGFHIELVCNIKKAIIQNAYKT